MPRSRTGSGSRPNTPPTETSLMIKKLILSTLLFCGIATAAPTPAPTSTLDAVLERGVL
ncbi:amino acid ABC transporter substrate-binding protein, partial [Aeromonas veronii]